MFSGTIIPSLWAIEVLLEKRIVVCEEDCGVIALRVEWRVGVERRRMGGRNGARGGWVGGWMGERKYRGREGGREGRGGEGRVAMRVRGDVR